MPKPLYLPSCAFGQQADGEGNINRQATISTKAFVGRKDFKFKTLHFSVR